MIRLFSESNPVNVLLIFILGLVLRIPFFINPVIPIVTNETGYLYLLLHESFFTNLQSIQWLSPLIAYILIFLQGLYLNGLVNNTKLFGTSHLLYLFVYVVFSALIPQWTTVSPFICINTIFIFIFSAIITLYQNRSAQNEIFLIAVLLSAGSLLFKPFIVFLLLLYIALLVLRPFRFSEWAIVLIGYCLPYYLLLTYFYVWDHWSHANQLIPFLRFGYFHFTKDPSELIALLFLLLPSVLGIWHISRYTSRTLALQRKIWAIVFYYFFLAVVLFTLNSQGCESLFLLLLPASFYIAGFFYFPSVKFFPNVFAWLTIGFLFVRNFL